MSATVAIEADGQAEGLTRARILYYYTVLVLIAALTLGGATATGFPGDVVLQLLSIPLLALVISIPREPGHELGRLTRVGPVLFCIALFAVPAFQLLPLGMPKAVGQRVPELAALKSGSISISPTHTANAMLSLVVPVSVFLAVAAMGWRERRTMSLIIMIIAVFSGVLGLAQLSGGPTTPLRLYTFTNVDDAVGFFANRNHFAALLYTATPFAFAWTIHALVALQSVDPKERLESKYLLPLAMAVAALGILAVTQPMSRSRAGVALMMGAILGGIFMLVRDRRRLWQLGGSKALLWTLGGGLFIGLQFGFFRLFDRFKGDVLEDARVVFGKVTSQAAQAFMPFGSGVGTFPKVYGLFETAKDAVAGRFANRAHNDLLESWLEGGVLSLSLMLVFGLWLVWSWRRIWRRQERGFDIDHALARGASVAILLLIGHSLLDYPLRTAAMMTTAAVLCALVLPAPRDKTLRDAITGESSRRQRHKARQAAKQALAKQRKADGEETEEKEKSSGGFERRMPVVSSPVAQNSQPTQWPDAWANPPAAGQKVPTPAPLAPPAQPQPAQAPAAPQQSEALPPMPGIPPKPRE